MNGALDDTPLSVHQYAARPVFVFTCVNQDGDPIDLSEADVTFIVYDQALASVFAKTVGDGITITGAGGNIATVELEASDTATSGVYRYELRRTTEPALPLAVGAFTIVRSALVFAPE